MGVFFVMKKQVIQMNNTSTIMENFIFFIKNRESKNCAKATIRFYKELPSILSGFCSLDEPVEKINKEFVADFIRFLKSGTLAEQTVNSYLRRFRAFAYFLMEEEIIDSFKIRMPHADKPLKEAYTEEELSKLLKKPNLKKCSFAEYRSWVMVNYFLSTGQRMNSVLNIKIKDLDLNEGVIRLNKVKNRHATILPLSSDLIKILSEYMRYRRGCENDYLFCTDHEEQLTSYGLTSAIKRFNHSRGVKKTSIHLFRNTYAKLYLMNGGDAFRLQKLMCHADIATTKEYLNLSVEDLRQDYDRLNPLNNVGKSREKVEMKKAL